jgi:hypothetical protein
MMVFLWVMGVLGLMGLMGVMGAPPDLPKGRGRKSEK